MLATPAAIADVRPDWMTPKTKCSYLLGIRSIVLSNLATSRGPTARDTGTSKTLKYVPVVPAPRAHDCLHECRLAVAVGPVEAKGRTPVMKSGIAPT
jgi:hypothetical protein